jgi:hypothetical protein
MRGFIRFGRIGTDGRKPFQHRRVGRSFRHGRLQQRRSLAVDRRDDVAPRARGGVLL